MDFCSLPKLVQPSRLKDTIQPDNDLIIIVDTYQIMSICQAQVVRNGPCYAMQWWIQMTFSTANVHISQVHILSFPMQTTYTLTFFVFSLCCQQAMEGPGGYNPLTLCLCLCL